MIHRLSTPMVVIVSAIVAAGSWSAPAPKVNPQPKIEQEEAVAADEVSPAEAGRIRAKSVNNLKQMGIAMHNHQSAYEYFPMNVVDKNGKPLLSWRVMLLPYLECAELFDQFKLDEPWGQRKQSEAAGKYAVDIRLAARQGQEQGLHGVSRVCRPRLRFFRRQDHSPRDRARGWDLLYHHVRRIERGGSVDEAR
jgi:Protein of unknown function (DUF1559)